MPALASSMSRKPFVLVAVLGSVGCAAPVLEAEPVQPAAQQRPAPQPDRRRQVESREIYELAEARFADGDPAQAAALMVRALDELPSEVDPEVRHDLETRLTHMQLHAWERTRDLEMLLAARERLYLLLSTHRERTRDLQPVLAETLLGELFEQLYEVEQRLQPFVTDSPEVEAEQLAVLTEVANAPAQPQEEQHEKAVDEGEPRVSSGNVRQVRVRTKAQQRLGDPDVQARFRSAFSDPGPYLTRQNIDKIHGPRSLVRVVGAKHDGDDRAWHKARKYVRANREAFVACYEEAFARQPVVGLQLQLKLKTEDGEIVSAYVEDGTLVDRVGDRCLKRALMQARQFDLDTDDETLTGTTHVRLMFFYDSPVYMVTETGENFSPGQKPTKAVPRDYVEEMKFPTQVRKGNGLPRR